MSWSNWIVSIRKNSGRVFSTEVTASSQKQAISEARQVFQWKFGYSPLLTSVIEVRELSKAEEESPDAVIVDECKGQHRSTRFDPEPDCLVCARIRRQGWLSSGATLL